MSDAQIKHRVDRFLGWRLPEPWNPDGGVSYSRPNYAHAPADHDWPSGTNLFDATQAEAMVRHMVDGAPATLWEVAYREEADKFQQETRRTSEQSELIRRMVAKLGNLGHRSDGMPPCRDCELCNWLADAEELLARPINVSGKTDG